MRLRRRLIGRLGLSILVLLLFAGVVTRPAVGAPEVERFNRSLNVSGQNSYLEVADAPELTPTDGLTIEAWIRPVAGNESCPTVLSKDYTSAYWFGLCNGRISFNSNGTASGQGGQTVIPTDVWTHIAVTWEKGGQRRYYLNGDLDFSGPAGLAPTANGAPLFIGQNPRGLPFSFSGNLAEVRLWSIARPQSDIRRSLLVALREPLPGLVANWNLADTFEDGVGGHHGVARGGAQMSLLPAPPRPAVVPIDTDFNRLPAAVYGAATAYVPSLNRLIVAGGLGGRKTDILSVDPANGKAARLAGALPEPSITGAAAYAPDQNQVYLFGGSRGDYLIYDAQPGISAIDPVAGTVRPLATRLPAAVSGSAAVYHPGTRRIYLFGGANGSLQPFTPISAVSTVSVFDPATETITPARFTLPEGVYLLGAAYSSLTGRIYLFGGDRSYPLGTADTVYEVTIDPDALGGSVRELTDARLPQKNSGFAVADDPVSGLIYLLGGTKANRVLAFDPVAGRLWPTPIALPADRSWPAAVYDRSNRQALLIGGSEQASAKESVWQIPLGDGPAIPLGRWDFPTPTASGVTAIDGDEQGVVIGTESTGVAHWKADGTAVSYLDLESFQNDRPTIAVGFNAALNRVWMVGPRYAVMRDASLIPPDFSPRALYYPSDFGQDKFTAFARQPFISGSGAIARDPNFEPFFGASKQVGDAAEFSYIAGRVIFRGFQNFFRDPAWYTALRTPEQNGIRRWYVALRHRTPGELWALGTDGRLRQMLYNGTGTDFQGARIGGADAESDAFGVPCGYEGFRDLAWGPNGDLYAVAVGSTPNTSGVCRAINLPGTPSYNTVLSGGPAYSVSVDRDGRVWVARGPNALLPGGGLSAFQSDPATKELRTGDWNWLNAPIGSRVFAAGAWTSLLQQVGAVDERVWAGGTDGRLVTLAQRWQQLDGSNGVRSKIIDKVWTVRGRAFLAGSAATGSGLFVLQPDGQTWDNRPGLQVRAVLGDRRGRIWVGTETGVRRYTPTGWDELPDAVGDRPAGPVRALAEDRDGRIWIGGDQGLTLFDRERFVATFTQANAGLPATAVKALLVDRDNRLWIGTDAGLARLDGATFTTFTTANGLPANAITDLALLGTGQVAASTSAGTALFDGTKFAIDNARPNQPLAADERGRLWAGASVKNPDGYQNYYWTNSGLASSTVSGVAADQAGRVWFSQAPNPGVSVRGAYLPPLPEVIPTVTGISPSSGKADDLVVISGTGFGQNPADLEVRLGALPVEIVSLTPTAITVRIGAQTISGDVMVRRLRRTVTLSVPNRPAFCAVPVIRKVTPPGGNFGVPVRIRGTNFDPILAVSLGGPARRRFGSPTLVETVIQPGDAAGLVGVKNDTPGCPSPATTLDGFSLVTLKIEQVEQLQGLPNVPLVAGKPTLLRLFLSATGVRSSADLVQVSGINIEQRDPATGELRLATPVSPTTAAVPIVSWPPPPETFNILEKTFNGIYYPSEFAASTVALANRGYELARRSDTVPMSPANRRTLLMVPILPTDYTPDELVTLISGVNTNLADLKERMMPWGATYAQRAPYVVTRSTTLRLDKITDNFRAYLREMRELDRVRRDWQRDVGGSNQLVVGLVQSRVKDPNDGAAGVSALPRSVIEELGFDALETLCDVGSGALAVVTFGIVDATDDCDLDLPGGIVWSNNVTGGSVSRTIAHELGHSQGLVDSDAPNYESDTSDLPGKDNHSRYDEIENGYCSGGTVNATKGTAAFNQDYTLYADHLTNPSRPSPIVNPLLPGTQLLPNLGSSSQDVSTRASLNRAKSILSYACNRNDSNLFFDRADVEAINAQSILSLGGRPQAQAGGVRATAATLQPRPIAGERIAVSGLITPSVDQGLIDEVRALGPAGPVSPGFVTEYALVQVDAAGRELGRLGIRTLPFNPPTHEVDSVGLTDFEYFSATIVRQSGLAAIELRRGDRILATFRAGGAPPTVSITSPTGGVFATGALPVGWTAGDPDGDPVLITVEYSRDGGTSWQPAGYAEGTGTLDLPLALLGGSADARLRLTASDGFNSTAVTSATFSVANRPPAAFISSPVTGTTLLENRPTLFTGGAIDNQDDQVADAGLRWTSSRDGFLGSGSRLLPALSAGPHLITLEATNSAGLQATASLSVTVAGDYDGDGVADDEELRLGLGLSPLESQDVLRDANGLPLIVKVRRGLDPTTADSDGDGRTDAEEIAAGTDPGNVDQPPGPDKLTVSPAAVTLAHDPARPTLPAQKLITVDSREPVSWTVSSNAAWLSTTVSSGQTFGSTTAFADTRSLSAGVYGAALTFASDRLGSLTVPVTVTVGSAATITPTVSPTATVGGTATITPTPSPTATVENAATITATPSPTATVDNAATITPTPSPEASENRVYLPGITRSSAVGW